jgi:hypothetical protein
MKLKAVAVMFVAALTLLCVVYALGLVRPSTTVRHEGFIDAEGNVFTGEYLPEEDAYAGSVTIVFADGAVYVGGFGNNRFNGPGQYCSASGWEIEGTFRDGELLEETN